MALDFYHGHGSPYSWRVWLALEHKAAPYQLKVLSFQANDTKKPEFVAINPRHQVPTIVDDGFALWESTVILEYLDERFSSGAKLYPGDAKSRGRIRRLARELRGKFLAGDAPTAADFVLYPYLAYCARITSRKPETKLDELVSAPMAEYRKRIEALPFFDKTFPPHWR